MIHFSRLLKLASVLMIVSGTQSARADLVNGGFESGNFTGYTLLPDSGNGQYTYVTTGVRGITPHSGSYFATFSNTQGQGASGFSQTVATTAGQTYDLSFDFTTSSGSDANNQLKVTFDGTTLLNMTNFASYADVYQNFNFLVNGTGSDTVTFSGYQNSGYNGLDDISLTPTAIPEPPSLLAILTGLPVCLVVCRFVAKVPIGLTSRTPSLLAS